MLPTFLFAIQVAGTEGGRWRLPPTSWWPPAGADSIVVVAAGGCRRHRRMGRSATSTAASTGSWTMCLGNLLVAIEEVISKRVLSNKISHKILNPLGVKLKTGPTEIEHKSRRAVGAVQRRGLTETHQQPGTLLAAQRSTRRADRAGQRAPAGAVPLGCVRLTQLGRSAGPMSSD